MHRTAAAFLVAALPWPSAGAAGPAEGELSALVQAIAAGNRPEVEQAIERIRFRGNPRQVLLQMARMATEGELTARRNAAYAMSVLADPSYAPALIPALQDADPAVREKICTALGRMKARKSASALLPLVRDPATPVRREALRALAALKAREAMPKVLEALGDAEAEPRTAAILALGELGDARAAAKLLPLLQDSSETTRLAAAGSLCKLGHAQGRAYAERMLGSKDPGIRKDAAKLLADVQRPWVRPALASLLTDSDVGVRIAAARGLSAQGDGRGVEWLVLAAETADPELRVRLEEVIEELGLSRADRQKILAARKK